MYILKELSLKNIILSFNNNSYLYNNKFQLLFLYYFCYLNATKLLFNILMLKCH